MILKNKSYALLMWFALAEQIIDEDFGHQQHIEMYHVSTVVIGDVKLYIFVLLYFFLIVTSKEHIQHTYN